MVNRIEKIEDGKAVQHVEPDADGNFHCYPEGQTMAKYRLFFETLDEVAVFLIRNQRGRVRMNPGWAMIVDDIYIDGNPRENIPN